jgi:DNA-directed RNA polymerase subunit RPC12/RpoP
MSTNLELTSHPERAAALATGAVLTETNEADHDWLGGSPPLPDAARAARKLLAEGWNVSTPGALGKTLDWLFDEGHSAAYLEAVDAVREGRASPFASDFIGRHGSTLGGRGLRAWDLGRAVNVAGWGALGGLLDEEAAWQRVLHAANETRRLYGSWAEFGAHYALGRHFWSREEDPQVAAALRRLLHRRGSPWRRHAWERPLDGAPTASAEVAGRETGAPDGGEGHPAAPRTQAEQFAVALLGVFGPPDHKRLTFLGGLPRGVMRLSAGDWFQPGDRSPAGAERVARHFARFDPQPTLAALKQLAQKGDPGPREQLGWLARLGEEGLGAAIQAWAAANTATAVCAGYVGRWLQAEVAWDILLEVARATQPRFSSWEAYLRASLAGRCFVSACDEPEPLLARALEQLLHDEDSPARRIPWDTDLSSAAPPVPPSRFLPVALRVATRCSRCAELTRLGELAEWVQCARCGLTQRISAERWAEVLGEALYDARLHREPGRHFLRAFGRLDAEVTWEHAAPRCPRCHAELSLAPLSRDPGEALHLGCQCGARVLARRPTGVARGIDPELHWLMVDAAAGGTLHPAEPLVVSCLRCGAPGKVDGTERVPTCEYCGAANFVSPQLWARYHPPPRAPTLWLLLGPQLPPLDAPKPRPRVDVVDGLKHGTLAVDFAARFPPTGMGEPEALPPQPALDAAMRWMLALGAVDVHLRGMDHARIAGVPRTIAYQVAAGAELGEALELFDPEALEAAVEACRDRSAVQRARRRLSLLRLGYAVGWLDWTDVRRHLLPLAKEIQAAFDGWEAYAAAHRARAKAAPDVVAACEALLADPASPWRTIPWATDLEGGAALDDRGPLEAIRVRVSLGCVGCGAEVAVDDLLDRVACDRCGEPIELADEPWGARLEQPVFTARQLELDVVDRATDLRDVGELRIDVARGLPRCGQCDADWPLDALELDRPAGPRRCPRCDAPFTVRPADAAALAIDPRARFVISGLPATATVAHLALACPSCRAPLEVEGDERVLVCGHCGAHGWMSDRDWLALHPAPRRRGFALLVSRNRATLGVRPLPDPDDSVTRSFLVRGTPTSLEGHRLPSPERRLALPRSPR